jgi:hypothetical protein
MSGLPFLAALVCVIIVLFWYLRDESVHGGSGKSGLLGMKDANDNNQRDGRAPNWKPNKDAKPWRTGRR